MREYKYLGQVREGPFGKFEVISYVGGGRYKVRFLATGYETDSLSKHVSSGKIKDLFKPHVCGVGFLGGNKFKCKNEQGSNSPAYERWRGLLRRCYSEERVVDWKNYGGRGVTVSEDWHNFQNFAEWYYDQKGCDLGFHLDKDLVDYTCKIYKSDTCTLVPVEINALFTGGFKTIVSLRKDGKYLAQIQRGEKCTNGNKRQSFLGYFSTKDQAQKAFFKAKIKHVKEVADRNRELLDERVYNNLTNPEWVREYILYLSNQNEEK